MIARVKLLISVVKIDEVAAALTGGADIIDVKDPREGSLGAPAPDLLRTLRAEVRPPALLSAALGDAPHLPHTMALAAAGAAGCGADYLKVGLRGSSTVKQAHALLTAVRRATIDVAPRTRLVAVAYADAARIGALPPAELPGAARDAGIHGVMLDTFVKDGRSSFDALDDAGIASFMDSARSLGLMTALAGALQLCDVERAGRLGVDIIGVRGAACDGGRDGTVSASRVRALRAALLLSAPACPASAPL
jgi:uncharacterized protein (UPF0264 family)